MRQYYSIVPNSGNIPEGLFYKDETDTTLDLIGLNRLTKVWESMPGLVAYFVGSGSGDSSTPISKADAARWAAAFGTQIPEDL